MRPHQHIFSLLSLVLSLTAGGCTESPSLDAPPNGGALSRDMGMRLSPSRDMAPSGGITQPSDLAPPADMTPPLSADAAPPTPPGPPQPCESPCDCPAGLDCLSGSCERGPAPIYCCDAAPCPEGSACRDGRNRARECGSCATACDCPLGQGCEGGLCVITDAPTFCCERSPCPEGAPCESPRGDARCEPGCQTACDCWGGQACVAGRCEQTPEPAFCCERALCPYGVACEHDDGSAGVCPVDECVSACDCPRGQACVGGVCELSGSGLVLCCDDAACPFGQACDTSTGARSTCMGDPECYTACDCLAGFECAQGECVIGEAPVLCCDKAECGVSLLCQWSTGVVSPCE